MSSKCAGFFEQNPHPVGGFFLLGETLGGNTQLFPDITDNDEARQALLNIREWYRCEYACQQLFELMQVRQPKQMPNLDALGFQIFNKIDSFKPPPKRSVTTESLKLT